MGLKIDPECALPAFESRHANSNEIVRNAATGRTTIYRPTIEHLTLDHRCTAWPRRSANVFSISGIIIKLDAARDRALLHIYIGGTKECKRWFPIRNICETWHFEREA